MDVPIQHIIGTVALIGLIVTVGLAYTSFTSSIQDDIIKQQMEQVAENVARNIVEIANLLSFANYGKSNFSLMKVLDLPENFAERGYAIQLLDQTTQGKGYCVRTFLASANTTVADSPIPLNSTDTQLVIATNFTADLSVRGETTTIQCSNIVYAGPKETYNGIRNIVVWGWTGQGYPMVGIGVWQTGG
jgi:hypothetical protein